MGSQTLEILRQGVWASLTGGWFFDPHQEIFTNTFHFYLWILLLCLPFSLFLGTAPSQMVWFLYCLVVGVLFVVIKCLNFRLHLMFDGEEILSEDGKHTRAEQNTGGSESASGVDTRVEVSNNGENDRGVEAIQLKVIRRSSAIEANEEDKDTPTPLNFSDRPPLDPQQEHSKQETKPTEEPDMDFARGNSATHNIQVPGTHKETQQGEVQDCGDTTGSQPSGHINSRRNLQGSDQTLKEQNDSTEVIVSGAAGSLQENDQTDLTLESKGELSDTLSDLSTLPLPIMESHLESQSAPGLAVSDLWKLEKEEGLLPAAKSEGSNVSYPSPSLEAVVAALDSFDQNRQQRNKSAGEVSTVFDETASSTKLDSRRDSEDSRVSSSSNNPTSLSRKESQNEHSLAVHRPRSISDIVHDQGSTLEVTSDDIPVAVPGMDHSISVHAPSLQESGRMHDPSTSSQPESIDSSNVNIMLNKDTASTVAQTGSIGDPEGSGVEGSDLALTRRSSALSSRRRTTLHRRRRDRPGAVRRRRRTDSGVINDVLIQGVDSAAAVAHVASSHEDTSPGALHCYQDEYGNWHTYMFEGDAPYSASIQLPSGSPSRLVEQLRDNWDRDTSSSSSTMAVEHSSEAEHLPALTTSRLSTRTRWHDTISSASVHLAQHSSATPVEKSTVPHYFKFQLLPSKFIKIKFDRLALLALLDRNRYVLEAFASVVLAISVSVLGYKLLLGGFYKDFWIFLFCFVLAGCQFSLVKSVQPDAASPTHGHNHMVAFSRPFYFCALASAVLILDEASQAHFDVFTLYGLPLCTNFTLKYTRDFLLGVILGLPLISLVGLLPQVNTFALYVLEQLDMHVFGGNAMTTLYGAVYSFLRSVCAVGVLFGLCYGAITAGDQGGQHVLFSVFSGLLVAMSYHLSRSASDPSVNWALLKSAFEGKTKVHKDRKEEEFVDPLPQKLKTTVAERLQNDVVCCMFILVFVFAIHVSTVFTALQPYVSYALYGVAGFVGILNHYLWPQFHKPLPWLCFAKPFFRSHEHNQFEVRDAAKIMVFERIRVWLTFVERNFLYPAVFLSALTTNAVLLTNKFGAHGGPLVICITGLKLMRSCFSDSSRQHFVLILTVLFFYCDYSHSSETFLVDYFVVSIFMSKFYELLLKVRFIMTYIAPWQITWGSAFHAFAQPFSVPHSAMLFFQACVSSFLSAPLNPFLGSAIFVTSYVRPVKFWEKDYNTSRVDHSNTRLSSQLDRSPGSDDNNLNSIFYEHLTRSLQHSLCGDLMMGRWGPFSTGDCFVLASDYLNALVHIIEVGNGLVTFQLRGLEFRGTYCQQREVEAITEGVEDDEGCCCCEPGHLPGNMLSVNAAFGQRWLAWEVSSTKYIVEGYSISDNSAASMLQVFDLRKILVTYYVKSVIFYVVRSTKLDHWLHSTALREPLESAHQSEYVDIDSTFYHNIDEDYDLCRGGISRLSFVNCYLAWIQHCASRKHLPPDSGKDSFLVTLCFSLCVLARRALGTASHHQSASLESFLFGLHALFKGDFRITSPKDEWVFSDMDLLRKVVAPGVRMSLKLHQDHFTAPEEYDNLSVLYEAILSHETNLVISHEGDPAWRQAVLANTASLLALRHVFDDGTDEYKIIMLNKRYLSFRVIKVNRECVRGLWAGQLQELIFLRNRNPERGSIQNAKQALRNIINSSCDQPIGYPIYVSPLTTSYADTNYQLSSIIGGPLSFGGIARFFRGIWHRVRLRCGASCQRSDAPDDIADPATGSSFVERCSSSTREGAMYAAMRRTTPYSSFVRSQTGMRTSVRSLSGGHPFVAASKRPSLNLPPPPSAPSEDLTRRVRISDLSQVYDTINLGRRIDVQWPSEHMREHGGRNTWTNWSPEVGMEGTVVHHWFPHHVDPAKRSHVDRVILLVQIDDKFVPVAEAGVYEAGVDV